MFFSDWRLLRRRWYVVLFGVAATIGLCLLTSSLVPVTYQATANILLLPPPNVVGTKGNPYLNLGGLSTVGDIVARSMTDTATHDLLTTKAPIKEYEVVMDQSTGAPVLLVTVTNPSPSDAKAALAAIVDEVPVALKSIQMSEGVITPALIHSTVISRDEKPSAQHKSQLRAMLVVLAAGLGMTWLSAALLDSLLLRRRLGGTSTGAREATPAAPGLRGPGAGPDPGGDVVPGVPPLALMQSGPVPAGPVSPLGLPVMPGGNLAPAPARLGRDHAMNGSAASPGPAAHARAVNGPAVNGPAVNGPAANGVRGHVPGAGPGPAIPPERSGRVEPPGTTSPFDQMLANRDATPTPRSAQAIRHGAEHPDRRDTLG